MSDLAQRLQEAARLAEGITVESDDICIGIRLRSYGFLIEARRETADDKMHNQNKQVHWHEIERAKHNALLSGVEDLHVWAKSASAAGKEGENE